MGGIVHSLAGRASVVLAAERVAGILPVDRCRRAHKLGAVVNWFRRNAKRVDAPRLRPRSSATGSSTKVDLAELTPELMTYLGKAAYLQLMIFENLGRAIATAPTTGAKSSLSRAASFSLAKHEGLTAEIARHGDAPDAVMDLQAREIDRFQQRTQGSDWFEAVTTCYLTAGFLDDFFARLARGLPSGVSDRVADVLDGPSGEDLIAQVLLGAIESNPRLGARLALWGRRLVGDTMLIARSALALSDNHDSDEARIEPVFTELIAAHTRRMDVLGLTA